MKVGQPKRFIFGSLFAAFLVYTVMVYIAPPNVTPAIPVTESVQKGHQLFQENNCIACHQLYGLGGYMGPDLTNVISNKGAMYAKAFIAGGSERMPNFNLAQDEIDALVSFLTFVDASGKYPNDNYQVYWYGAVVEASDE